MKIVDFVSKMKLEPAFRDGIFKSGFKNFVINPEKKAEVFSGHLEDWWKAHGVEIKTSADMALDELGLE